MVLLHDNSSNSRVRAAVPAVGEQHAAKHRKQVGWTFKDGEKRVAFVRVQIHISSAELEAGRDPVREI